jgi:putative salt-induced outer membrane protein
MKLLLILLVPMLASAEYKFSNESEFSMVKTGGNSNLETYNLKTESTYTRSNSTFGVGGHYTLGTAENASTGESEENARNWDGHLKYEHSLSKSFSAYAGWQIEGDKFSNIDTRNNYDLGGKYIIKSTDKVKSHAELGYRLTNEKRINADADGETEFDFTKIRAYYEIFKQQTDVISWKFWVEYLPNLDESEDYIITYEPSIAVALNKTFSLKMAYKGVYDNQPNAVGLERLDYTHTTSLIAKF